MDRELTFHPETQRTRDLVYSEFSSCDRSLHLLIQEAPGVAPDLLLKAYRETVAAYLSASELVPPADFLRGLVQRFDRVCRDTGTGADVWKKMGMHVVVRALDAVYVLTTREREICVGAEGRMSPVLEQDLVRAERLRLESAEPQGELFPTRLGDFLSALKLDTAALAERDLVLGCGESDADAVLEGLSGALWLQGDADREMTASRRSVVTNLVSRKIVALRFDRPAGMTRASGAGTVPKRRGRRVSPRRVILPVAGVLVAALIAVLWRREAPEPQRVSSAQESHAEVSLREADETAPASGDGRVDALPRTSEAVRLTEKWRQSFGKEVTSSPILFEEAVIFGCRDGGVYALDRRSGAQLWKFTATAGVGSSPAAWGDRVIIADYNGNVFGLKGRTGERVWTRKLPMRVVSSPAVSGDRVVVGCYDGSAYCLSAENGAVLWKVRTGGRIRGSAAASGDLFYVPSYDGDLYALQAGTGQTAWRLKIGGTVSASPIVCGNIVVIGGTDGRVHGVDASTGVVRWTSATQSSVESRIGATADAALVGSNDGRLYCFNLADGSIAWKCPTGRAVLGRPVVTDGVVYAGSYDGGMYAIEAASGRVLDTFAAGSPVYSSPLVAEGLLYFGTNRGEFICVSLATDVTG